MAPPNTKKMDTPIHMIIAGMTACGKTYYLLKMSEEEYANHFDYIFIVCPTFEDNKTYQNWEYLKYPDVFAIACDHDKVESVVRDIVKFAKNTNSLVILDDCAASKDVKNRTSELVKLAFSGRHIGLSTTVITQQLTNFHHEAVQDEHIKTRNLLQPPQGRQKEHVREPPGCQQVRATKNLDVLKSKKYARLEILIVHPYTHKVVVP